LRHKVVENILACLKIFDLRQRVFLALRMRSGQKKFDIKKQIKIKDTLHES